MCQRWLGMTRATLERALVISVLSLRHHGRVSVTALALGLLVILPARAARTNQPVLRGALLGFCKRRA